mgnify:CR=1 FL=1
MQRFRAGENVLYREGKRLRDAKIIRYEPLTDSYLVKIMYKNGTVRERETIASRLVKKQKRRANEHNGTFHGRLDSLNRRMNEMHSELAYLSSLFRARR